jgi:hypothetical protein
MVVAANIGGDAEVAFSLSEARGTKPISTMRREAGKNNRSLTVAARIVLLSRDRQGAIGQVRLATGPTIPLPAFASEAATTAAGTLRLWARLVDVQGAATKFRPVHGRNGFLALSIVCHFNEAKAAWLAGVTIRDDVDTTDSAVGFKQRTDRFFRSIKTEVSNVNILHFSFPFPI